MRVPEITMHHAPLMQRTCGAGLVCEHWGVADMLGLAQPLGVAPA
jgi:hypothetical protein